MKFNKSFDNGSFDEYREYLHGIKDKLPVQVFEFVINVARHDLGSDSLHDSWIKKLTFLRDFQKESNELVLTLLGAYHDREFELVFVDVKKYKIDHIASKPELDLITFEIGVEEMDEESEDVKEEMIVFRAMFAGEDECVEIFAKDIEIREIQYTQAG